MDMLSLCSSLWSFARNLANKQIRPVLATIAATPENNKCCCSSTAGCPFADVQGVPACIIRINPSLSEAVERSPLLWSVLALTSALLQFTIIVFFAKHGYYNA